MSMLALLMAAAAPGDAPPVTLVPSGKWQLEYAKSSCILSRPFGDGAQKLILALKPAPFSDVVGLILIQPAPKARGVRGKADVKLSGGYVPENSDFTSVSANGFA